MTTSKVKDREHQRLLEVAREYRQRGYEVIVEPSQSQLPDFLASFRIDMLARNETENVILEVRTQESMTDSPDLTDIARAVQDKKTWRFELVVTNPKDKPLVLFKNAVSLDSNDINYRLREAKLLSDHEHGEAAFLLAWSAVEAVLRYVAEQESVPGSLNNSIQVVKNLFGYGLLDKEQYQILLEGVKVRNTLVHGYKEPNSLTTTFDRILRVTNQLAQQYLA